MLVSSQESISISEFWLENKKMHFSATREDDLYIYNTWKDEFFDRFEIVSQKHKHTKTDVLESIIFFDQFTRHFNRVNAEIKPDDYSELCVDASLYLLESFDGHISCDARAFSGVSAGTTQYFSDSQMLFILLPLRHSKKKEHILTAIKYSRTSNFTFHALKDFLRYTTPVNWKPKPWHSLFDEFDLCENKNDGFRENDNTSLGISNLEINTSKLINSEVFKQVKKHVLDNNIKRVCMSFSGGVDSTSVFASLIHLRNTNYIDEIRAVHINYANKEFISDADALFCKKFAEYHNVDIFVREIEEIKKSSNQLSRESYENYTQLVRFSTYKFFAPDFPVFLGHNKDDTYENISTNIKAKRKYHLLTGMRKISEKHGVQIHRSILDVSKEDVCVSMEGTNHTLNSTLPTCSRGLERKNPLDLALRPGLVEISKILEEYYSFADIFISHSRSENTFVFNLTGVSDTLNICYISKIINSELVNQKKPTISLKFINDFVSSRKFFTSTSTDSLKTRKAKSSRGVTMFYKNTCYNAVVVIS